MSMRVEVPVDALKSQKGKYLDELPAIAEPDRQDDAEDLFIMTPLLAGRTEPTDSFG